MLKRLHRVGKCVTSGLCAFKLLPILSKNIFNTICNSTSTNQLDEAPNGSSEQNNFQGSQRLWWISAVGRSWDSPSKSKEIPAKKNQNKLFKHLHRVAKSVRGAGWARSNYFQYYLKTFSRQFATRWALTNSMKHLTACPKKIICENPRGFGGAPSWAPPMVAMGISKESSTKIS